MASILTPGKRLAADASIWRTGGSDQFKLFGLRRHPWQVVLGNEGDYQTDLQMTRILKGFTKLCASNSSNALPAAASCWHGQMDLFLAQQGSNCTLWICAGAVGHEVHIRRSDKVVEAAANFELSDEKLLQRIVAQPRA